MRAPAGGIVSMVNDKHYVGGQFLPEHGLFCGKGGAKRKATWDRFSDDSKRDLGGGKLYEVEYNYAPGNWCVIGLAIADSCQQAAAAFQVGRKRVVRARGR